MHASPSHDAARGPSVGVRLVGRSCPGLRSFGGGRRSLVNRLMPEELRPRTDPSLALGSLSIRAPSLGPNGRVRGLPLPLLRPHASGCVISPQRYQHDPSSDGADSGITAGTTSTRANRFFAGASHQPPVTTLWPTALVCAAVAPRDQPVSRRAVDRRVGSLGPRLFTGWEDSAPCRSSCLRVSSPGRPTHGKCTPASSHPRRTDR